MNTGELEVQGASVGLVQVILVIKSVAADLFSHGELLEDSSRALLNLAGWLKEDSKVFESVYPEMKSGISDLATLTQILHLESVTPGFRESLAKTIPVSLASTDLDLVLGRLLRLAVIQQPGLSKAWNELGDLGQRVVEHAGQNQNKTQLTDKERRAVSTILHQRGERERAAVCGVVSQICLKDSHMAGHEYEKWDFNEEGAAGDPDAA